MAKIPSDGAIDLAEAARRLGVAQASVRMAINRGFLKGYQADDGHWKVYLDQPAEARQPNSAADAAAPGTVQPGGDAAAAARTRMTMSVETLLAEQVEYLRGQLERRDETVAAKDALIAELTARLAKLGRSAVERLGHAPGPAEPVPTTTERAALAEQQEQQRRTLRNIAETLLLVRNHLEQQRARRPAAR